MKNMKQKIFLYLIVALAIAGAAISIHLTVSFYQPEPGGLIFCKGEGADCESVIRSEYSSVGGIPLSSYALLFYTFILFTFLITAYADGKYYYICAWTAIFPLSAMSLIADGILAGILIKLGKFCVLCVTTYLINILIFVLLLFYLQAIRKAFSVNLRKIFLSALKIEENYDRKAAAGCFVLFSIMLVLNLFLSGANLDCQALNKKEDPLEAIYASKPVDTEFPASPMIMGNPDAPIRLAVFTDFFCKACYQFYVAEKHLFSKYGDKISITYYNYPRGGSCDPGDGKEVSRSCIAAKAFLSAAHHNIFASYLAAHYDNYQGLYNEAKAVLLASMFMDNNVFREEMNSADTAALIERDLALARKLNITVTPTIFVNGRMLPGVPSHELLDSIIEKAFISAFLPSSETSEISDQPSVFHGN